MMTALRRFVQRLRNFLRPAAAETELAREISSHLALIEDDIRSRGVPDNAARLAARQSFGGVEQAKERHRDERSFRWLEDLRRDVQYAVRLLKRNPGFAVTAVLTITLAIGVNSAFFTLVNAVLLRPLPVNEPQRLVQFTYVSSGVIDEWFSYPLYEKFRDQTRSFLGVATGGSFTTAQMRAARGDEGETITAERVSGNYFSVLGVEAAVGRLLTSADDRRPVVVLSHGFWTRRFAGDSTVIGRSITIGETPFTIVGVAPKGFSGFVVGESPDLWWPLEMLEVMTPTNLILRSENAWWLQVIGRRKAGASMSQAAAEVEVIFQRDLVDRGRRQSQELGGRWNAAEQRAFYDSRSVLQDGSTGSTPLRKQYRTQLMILGTIVGIVLLVACANVANLMLARSTARRREIAARLALGANRARIVRQLLSESLLLAAFSGAVGIIVARWGASLLLAYLPQDGVALDLSPDVRVVLFTVGASIVTGIVFGLAPAIRATQLHLSSDLSAHTGVDLRRPRMGLHKVLVVAQVALTLFLLVGASLLVRTLINLKRLDAGFDPRNITLFMLNDDYDRDPSMRIALFQRLVGRLEALPGVTSATLFNRGLLRRDRWRSRVDVPGKSNENLWTMGQEAGPRFFETMRTPILHGRDIVEADIAAGTSADHSAPGVAVINETMARQYFGDDNPVGRQFSLSGPGRDSEQVFNIVGVAKDTKYDSLREAVVPTFVVPLPRERHFATFAIRTASRQAGLPDGVRRIVRDIDPNLEIRWFRTMDQVVDESLAQEHFIARLAGAFGALALLMASIGLYGVLSYTVTRRWRELAIRMSLGARHRRMSWSVFRETLLLIAVGVSIGLPAAFLAGGFVQKILFGVEAVDPASALTAGAILVASGAAAGYLPARRAGRVDPIVALRVD